jgi:hypothetical protein
MIGDHDDMDEVAEFDDEESADDLDAPTANVGETSVEINVDELIAEIEADSGVSSGSNETDPRKRLEKLLEERRAARELEEIDEFALESLD